MISLQQLRIHEFIAQNTTGKQCRFVSSGGSRFHRKRGRGGGGGGGRGEREEGEGKGRGEREGKGKLATKIFFTLPALLLFYY